MAKQQRPSLWCAAEERRLGLEFLKGHLVDHVHLRASDVEASERLYRQVYLGFQAPSRDLVHTSPAAALAAGGQDKGVLPRAEPGRDNIEAVHHDVAQCATASVVVKVIGS